MIVKQVLCVFAVLCASGVPEVRGAGPDEIRMIEIPPGEFIMGSRGYGAVEEFDEAPAHLVRISKPLRMSATEITNAQYERYDPAHRALRGKAGFSVDDDEAVVFVSYDDALGFCRWLSQKEGKKRSGNMPAGRAVRPRSILGPTVCLRFNRRSRNIAGIPSRCRFV